VENGITSAFHRTPALQQFYNVTRLLSFIAHLRRETLERGGKNGQLCRDVWSEAASELGLDGERARILWQSVINLEVDCTQRPWLAAELFADEITVPLTRFGAILFFSCVFPRPAIRENPAAFLDPPLPKTVVEDPLHYNMRDSVRETPALLVEGLQRTESSTSSSSNSSTSGERSILEMLNLTIVQMKRIFRVQKRTNNWKETVHVAALRRNPQLVEFYYICLVRILIVALGLSTRSGIVCAEALPKWHPSARLETKREQLDIDWDDVPIPVSCMEHLRFHFELPEIPLTFGWPVVRSDDAAAASAVMYAVAVSYMADALATGLGSCQIRNADLPWLHLRSIAGVRLMEDVYPHRWEFSALCRSTIIKRVEQDDIIHLQIRGCQDCHLDFIPTPSALLRAVTIRLCARCTIFVGACEALALNSCEKVTVVAAARSDVRIVNSVECQIYVFCNERPTVFGDNRLVSLAPAGFWFPDIERILQANGFRLECNRWNEPFDAELGSQPSAAAVRTMPPAAYWPPHLAWQGAGDITKSPWPVPIEYLEAYQRRISAVDGTRLLFREQLGDRKDAAARLQHLVSRKFRDWLGSSNHRWQIRNLLRLDRANPSIAAHEPDQAGLPGSSDSDTGIASV
jgi:hypothetical protein